MNRSRVLQVFVLGVALSDLSAVAAASTLPAPPSALTPPSDDQQGCLWVNQFFNTLFPDTHAQYSIAVLPIPPGGSVSIDGDFPHARYMSYNLYDEKLAPLDSLNDTVIAAEPGSVNPFAAGADRNATLRHYHLQLVAGVPPADPAQRRPNTLYSSQKLGAKGMPFNLAILFYRIYVPDQGTDVTGNTGLPRLRFVLPGGATLGGPGLCAQVHKALNLFPNIASIPEPLSILPLNTGAYEYPLWLKFFDLPGSIVARYYHSPLGPLLYEQVGQSTTESGGFASNADNRYLQAYISQQLGKVVAIHARFPDAPKTSGGQSPMPGGDMRYWSLCSNDSVTLSAYACVYDEQLARDATGQGIVLVSKARDRPANAIAQCGVTWLDWGLDNLSLLIYRNLLPQPQPRFPYAVQYVPGPSGQHEAQTMGAYYPYASHMSRQAFESLGCPVAVGALPSIVTPPP